jgi:hypothetical protein
MIEGPTFRVHYPFPALLIESPDFIQLRVKVEACHCENKEQSIDIVNTLHFPLSFCPFSENAI